jgi:hypothetical protein
VRRPFWRGKLREPRGCATCHWLRRE